MLAEDGDLLEDDFDSCQCDHAGFCNVFLKDVSQELWMYCQENEEYRKEFFRASQGSRDRADELSDFLIDAKKKKSAFDSPAVRFLLSDVFNILTPFVTRAPKQITIKGLERSGTGFIFKSLEYNIMRDTVFQGTKHDLYLEEDANIVLVVRNPYSWFASFRDFCNTKSTTRTNKIGATIHEAIPLWNEFYSKYISYKNKNVFIVKYEDFTREPENYFNRIVDFFDLKAYDNYTPILEYVNNYSLRAESGDGFPDSRKSYYLDKQFLGDLSHHEIETISGLLNKNLIKKLSYKLESACY